MITEPAREGFVIEPGTEREEFVPFTSPRAREIADSLLQPITEPTVLENVHDLAQQARKARAQAEIAQDAYVDALREALKVHTRDQVAEAAGVSFQAVYEALARRDGKRRTRRGPAKLVIDA